MSALPWVHDDGGRADAGFKGDAGDCVTRAIAIATTTPYRTVYDEMAFHMASAQPRKRGPQAGKTRPKSARNGVLPSVYKPWLRSWDWVWTPTMSIGSGTTVHLAEGELPDGRLIVRCSRHLTAVIDGIIHDTHDPSRDGTRAVYGYWQPGEALR